MIAMRNRDLAAERGEKLQRILRQQRIVRVETLCRDLKVSPATVRRDLALLERKGALQRVHGGAVVVESGLDEPLFDDKTAIAAAEKKRIALKAHALIQPNDSVFLDGGSTVLELCRLLREQSGVTVVTNSLRVALELAGGGPRCIVVGGELRRLSQTFVGTLTQRLLDGIHVDTAFIGTIGLSAANGLTTTDPREAFTKGLIMEHARQVVLLADSSKVGKVSFARFGGWDCVDTVITDKGIGRAETAALRKAGVRVVRA